MSGVALTSLAAQQVVRSAPDGYTMTLVTNSNIVQRYVQRDIGYDPLTDFSHVTQLTLGGSLLVVPADSPLRSVEDLVATVKAAPGKFNYGSGGAGTPSHMAAATLEAIAGLSMVHVPFKNSGDVVPAILRGDLQFSVQYVLKDPEDFLFTNRNPDEAVMQVAESAMREIVGQSQIQKILTADRKLIEPACQQLMQKVLDDYHSGVMVLQVLLLSVDPPQSVIAAFRDVTAAQQDLQRMGNEAEAYANRVVPEARGAAARIIQEAEAYREQTVAEARGQAGRFDKIYAQYKNAPSLTRQRLYIETMERVLGGAEKVVIDDPSKGGASVAPFLPLPAFAPFQGGQK